MKKAIRIFVSIIGFLLISLGIWIEVFSNYPTNYYMDNNTISILQGIGKLLLQLVRFVFSISSLILIFLIPIMIYKFFREEDIDFAFYKKWGGFIFMVLAGISILSIAGVQLRNLERFPNDAKEVIIKKQGTNPVIVKKDYFYFDRIKNDWVETSKVDYIKKNEEVRETGSGCFKQLTFSCESLGYTGYFKDTMIGGEKAIDHVMKKNKPKLKYFVFDKDFKKEITKDQFGNYLKDDSLVTYEEY
jgi:hypothetical protein